MAQLRRFYDAAIELTAGCAGRLSAAESAHASRVLRLRPGDPARVFDRFGNEFTIEFLTVNARGAEYRAIAAVQPLVHDAIFPVLCFALAKNDKIDWVLQKATELGICEFMPFECRRSVSRSTGAGRAEAKHERWGAIALAAVKQSERLKIPAIHPVVDFEQMLAGAAQCNPRLVCDEQLRFEQNCLPLSAVYRECFGRGENRPAVLIGPEGGFAREEVELAERQGWTRVSLGGAALRTETAAIAALAVLQSCAGRL